MSGIEEKKEAIPVTSTDKKDKKDENKPEELSEEDLALKEGLELAVVRLQEDDDSLHKPALDHLVNEIKSSTSSMTAVPKPLKFLRPHYDSLKNVYESWPIIHPMKKMMADVMSVLAMTMAPAGSRECLKFKLAGTSVNIASWGHEYVRSLSGEISEEFNQRYLENPDVQEGEEAYVDDLIALVDDILPFQMSHNAEAEAVDLLLEVRQLNKLVSSNPPVVDERNYSRVCLYLIRSAGYIVDPDEVTILYNTTYTIYKNQGKYTDALRVAMKMDSEEKIYELFDEQTNAPEVAKLQMALILGRDRAHHIQLKDEKLNEIISNSKLSEQFQYVGQTLNYLNPKLPEEIYKSEKSQGIQPLRSRNGNNANGMDTARTNLASSIVNGFVNAGVNRDKLILQNAAVTESKDDTNTATAAAAEAPGDWIGKNKSHGIMSATASIGLLMLWNIHDGLSTIDRYFQENARSSGSDGEYKKAGAALGIGILSSGVRNESDPALALLSEVLESTNSTSSSNPVRLGAIGGLGLAYSGARKEGLKDLLEPIIANSEPVGSNIVEASLAALSLAMSYVGTCNDDISSTILQRLMETSDADLDQTISRFLALSLGIIYMGKGERVDAILEAVRTIEHPRGKYAEIVLESCAYANTGNVLKVQQMLRLCTDHLTEKADHQAVAVLGIALIAFGEDIGVEMTLRTFEHLLHYGELPVRRVVPLALALLYISNPEYGIIDQLSRLSHDADLEVAMNAIMGLGLVSAGTNNSRVSNLLRQLAEFYSREGNALFTVRLAQGLNGLGRGLLSLSPFHSDRLLMNGSAVASILVVLHACLDIKGTLLDKYHYLIMYLTPAMSPRYLHLVDNDLQPVRANVRVGLAVETVGQAGRPKTITGFQTHTAPVLLGFKDRAELAGTDYNALGSVIEGIVIVEKNEDSMTSLGFAEGTSAATSINKL